MTEYAKNGFIRPIKYVVIDPNSDVIDAGDEVYTRVPGGKTWLSGTGGRFVMLTDTTTDPNRHLYTFKALSQVTNPHVPAQKPLSEQDKKDLASINVADNIEALDSKIVDFLYQLDDALSQRQQDLKNQRVVLQNALFNAAETPTP